MVSDQEIAHGVALLLRQSDPNVVRSVNGVVQQLEAKLGLDLSHKAAFIRDQIELLLGSPTHHRPPHHPKDHFALQHPPQFQNSHQLHHPIPSNPFQPPLSLHHHELGGGFRCLPPQQPQQQQQQQQPSPQHQPQHLQMSQPQVQPQQPLPQPTGPAAIAVPESPKESTQTGGKRRGGPGGLNKVCGVSPLLQTIVGSAALPRTEIVKQLWAYIRKNNLQDPSNKRKIICNDALRLVFETDCTDMFKMNKLLAKHIIPLEPSKDSGPDAKRLKTADMESAAQSNEPSPSLVIISDALAKFFGTGEREMLHSDAVRRVWEYIEVNHLEDPRGAVVVCDAKLQVLFGCESLPVLGISEMLMRHFFKRS